jgi:hypothetical protein
MQNWGPENAVLWDGNLFDAKFLKFEQSKSIAWFSIYKAGHPSFFPYIQKAVCTLWAIGHFPIFWQAGLKNAYKAKGTSGENLGITFISPYFVVLSLQEIANRKVLEDDYHHNTYIQSTDSSCWRKREHRPHYASHQMLRGVTAISRPIRRTTTSTKDLYSTETGKALNKKNDESNRRSRTREGDGWSEQHGRLHETGRESIIRPHKYRTETHSDLFD